MCGIAGFTGGGDHQWLQTMTQTMVKRGPDAQGLWSDPEKGVFLGHRRLSILDHDGGSQPMWSADGRLGVVFNGEIYNHRELRLELESVGHQFQSQHSDTETLLCGYQQWGENLPLHLNGMWAFCLYDRVRGRLFLSRDRLGKKPLFYTHQGGVGPGGFFAFASELNALIAHPKLSPQVSPLSVKKYFAYGYIPAPLSLYEGIFKLPGGFNLSVDFDGSNLVVKPYWQFELDPFETIPSDTRLWEEKLRFLLEQSVVRRLEADVPLGIFLSGGIDSSSIAYYAAKQKNQQVQTFSIGFSEKSFDESDFSTSAAKLLGVEHHLEQITHPQRLAQDIVHLLDEPFGDSSIIPTFHLCQSARKKVTVALGGDGADELFAGYDPFRVLSIAQWYQRLMPKPVHIALRALVARLQVSQQNLSLGFLLNRTLTGLDYPKPLWNPIWMGPLSPKDLSDLFKEPMDCEEIYSEAIEVWDGCKQAHSVDQTMQFFTRLYMQNGILTKVDRASMMNSLEVRSPYLDRDLVDFVRRIPHTFKLRRGCTKYILKKALEPVLPKWLLYRKKKGFGAPVGRWFQDGTLSFPNSSDAGLTSLPFQEYLDQHQSGKKDHRLFLWNYWVLNSCLLRDGVRF